MGYQLIYTSSPTSLTMGRTGFSTVARTADMPEKLSAIVERCGTYDISSGVIYTHRIITYYTQIYHILTRLKDAGVDYTNRNNYIAHHIILSADEIDNMANPAEILSQWDGWLDSWTTEPKLISAPIGLDEIVNKNSLPAKNWQEIFGDAKKAALLSDSTTYLSANVSDAKTILNLFSESLLLNITPKDAWKTTFTTSISTSENPADFNWRTITSEDKSLATIDLSSKTSPIAPQNRSAEYAQSGVQNNREKLNLKVSTPPRPVGRFNVVQEQQKSKFNLNIIYIISAIFTFIAVIAIMYVLFSGSQNSEPVKHTDLPKLDTSKKAPEDIVEVQQSKPKLSLFDTITLIREKIEENKFEQAMQIWNESTYSKTNPSNLNDILDDIGSRADSLMSFSENVFQLENPSEDEKAKAILYISIARQALDTQGLPKKDLRVAKWKTLNSKIAK